MLGPVTLVAEGATDVAAGKRLLFEAGLEAGPEYIAGGKSKLDPRITSYNQAARFSCWLILRDLDRDAACAPQLRRELLRDPATHMRLHIPVHSVEAWLLADSESLSKFLSIRHSAIPVDPDRLPRPKGILIELARGSRKKLVRQALVPEPGTTASQGPGYTQLLTEFIGSYWRPELAATRSRSLERLRDFLRRKVQLDRE